MREYFVNRDLKLASTFNHTWKNYNENLSEPTPKCMYIKPVVTEEIFKIFNKFKQNKSPGDDDMGKLVVKRVESEISESITMIFNGSFSTGDFPDNLKIAKVIPIYKKGMQIYFKNIDLFNRCIYFFTEIIS